MRAFTMTIDGSAAETLGTIGVVNPATGEVFAEAPDCTKAQLDLAMESAQKAFAGWKDDAEFRKHVMYECADAIEAAAEEMGRIATMEQGMPLANGIASVRGSAQRFRHYADLEVPRIVVRDDAQARVEVERVPLGVIAAIKPWNVPIGMAVNAVAPAFRAGCTMVLKPSPYTPLVTLMLGEVIREVVPAGVLNVISGADPLGQWMTEHPIPRGISFTGSVATGKRVNVTAAADLKRVLLELGGNDAAIVLDDADPTEVADVLFGRAFMNAGQICMAVKRVFVPESMHDALVERLAEKARALRVGNGLDEGTEMGPLNNKPQYERVQSLVAEAVAGGATAVAGGAPLEGDGYFYAPTILTGASEGTRIVDEEQFGPALPILPYRDLAEAIDRANSTMYGLGSSVWSSNSGRAHEVAAQLEAGTTWINTHGGTSEGAPFMGRKWSGLGAETDIYSVDAYSDLHTIVESRAGANTYVPSSAS
jgi:acyl-CoA reductase-like NAD-dependent aldehyde dehydrogenase